MYLSMTIDSQSVHALLEAGATHEFISVDGAKGLGIKATKERGTMKAVNSPAKLIVGVYAFSLLTTNFLNNFDEVRHAWFQLGALNSKKIYFRSFNSRNR